MADEKKPAREEALALLKEFNSDPSLIAHALAVEAVMRYIARKRGADEEEWGVVGLIHDLDYEKFPEQHCDKTGEILRERGWPEIWVRAAISHGWQIRNDVKPESELEKTLYAVDELTGLVKACALVRPSKSVADMEPKSVRKKWKDARFAAGVDRAVIQRGAELMGVELNDLIKDTIMGMRELGGPRELPGQ